MARTLTPGLRFLWNSVAVGKLKYRQKRLPVGLVLGKQTDAHELIVHKVVLDLFELRFPDLQVVNCFSIDLTGTCIPDQFQALKRRDWRAELHSPEAVSVIEVVNMSPLVFCGFLRYRMYRHVVLGLRGSSRLGTHWLRHEEANECRQPEACCRRMRHSAASIRPTPPGAKHLMTTGRKVTMSGHDRHCLFRSCRTEPLGRGSARPLIVKFRPAVRLYWSFFVTAFRMEEPRRRHACQAATPTSNRDRKHVSN